MKFAVAPNCPLENTTPGPPCRTSARSMLSSMRKSEELSMKETLPEEGKIGEPLIW
jgi:hypothetical protein